MTPWVSEYVPKQDVNIFRQIRSEVEALPDLHYERDEGGNQILLSCHILCRALARIHPAEVSVVDGYFRVGLSHSWLITRNNSIIDPYVPGAIGVLILPAPRREYHDVWYSMYTKSNLMEMHEVFSSWSFDRAVTQTEEALRALLPLAPIH